MRDAHKGLAIEQRHFDGVAVHLVETLRDIGVPEEIVAPIAGAVTPLSARLSIRNLPRNTQSHSQQRTGSFDVSDPFTHREFSATKFSGA